MSSEGRPRWTERRILAALQAWTREVGEPPRSYEWSPGTVRSLGRYNERAARWEREWPRWPGADTLRYRFGRFTKALEAAGLPARPLVFELSLPERVEAARRLALACEPTVAIADHLGVHPATVRSYLRDRPCRDCGTAVVSGAERCLSCALQRRRECAWTRAEIVAALRAWAAETGAPPTSSQWDSGECAAPGWQREPDRWPSAPVGPLALRKLGGGAAGGGLPGALARVLARRADRRAETRGGPPRPASGAERVGDRLARPTELDQRGARLRLGPPGCAPPGSNHRTGAASNEGIVAALRAWTARHGRPPLSSDWRRAGPDHPTAALAQARFGSWRAALEAAGVAPARVEWSHELVLDAIRTHIDRHGRPPVSSQWRRPDHDETPGDHVVINRFGSWRAAIAAARNVDASRGEER
jgi:hypothetical protein